jgi:hypothetical protein
MFFVILRKRGIFDLARKIPINFFRCTANDSMKLPVASPPPSNIKSQKMNHVVVMDFGIK